jgi:hypothetical protein
MDIQAFIFAEKDSDNYRNIIKYCSGLEIKDDQIVTYKDKIERIYIYSNTKTIFIFIFKEHDINSFVDKLEQYILPNQTLIFIVDEKYSTSIQTQRQTNTNIVVTLNQNLSEFVALCLNTNKPTMQQLQTLCKIQSFNCLVSLNSLSCLFFNNIIITPWYIKVPIRWN